MATRGKKRGNQINRSVSMITLRSHGLQATETPYNKSNQPRRTQHYRIRRRNSVHCTHTHLLSFSFTRDI